MTSKKTEIIINVGQASLTFSIPAEDGTVSNIPYTVKSGMSMAANLRAAFRQNPALTDEIDKARLIVATPPLLIPKHDFPEDNDCDIDTLYGNVITGHKGETKIVTEIPELNVVCIFPVNSDLLMVVNDHFQLVETENVMTSMWMHLYKTYYQSGSNRRLFVFFHDKIMDICNFEQHRIRFANCFNALHAHDALYYILYVWKQLGFSQQEDELLVLGDMPHADWLTERLNAYVSKVTII